MRENAAANNQHEDSKTSGRDENEVMIFAFGMKVVFLLS
jgi:hypothetical protein